MASESFKARLNIYIDSLIGDSFEDREIPKELTHPQVPRHEFFVERPETMNRPVRRHPHLGESA